MLRNSGRMGGDTARRQEVTDRICAEWEHLGRPLFVLACTACQVNLKQYCPEIQTISLYRYMDMYPEHLPAGNEIVGKDTAVRSVRLRR